MFTPDGVFVALSTARGRDELRGFFAGLQEGALTAWWHLSANETISIDDGDDAEGETWLDQPWRRQRRTARRGRLVPRPDLAPAGRIVAVRRAPRSTSSGGR
ncbi:hypothetical protein [Saccharopolyspora spinosa]|uniref:hypothetical protein n=1 Tax=Saccharopolyspora spinosa TaxID=60894 RepID=UPI00374A4FBC